jgi:hypothetical protein
MATSTDDNPLRRIVLKEFGLLNAGLFNKIRFPGRYEVDESGNRVTGSEYNMPAIDFTGDVADLYVEPDTFYVDGDNEIFMRKRKRNEDGEVTDVKRLKVGELKLTEFEQIREAFVRLGEENGLFSRQVDENFEELQTQLEYLVDDNVNISEFVEAINETLNTEPVRREKLSPDLQEKIDLIKTERQLQEFLLSLTYTKSTIDDLIEDAQGSGRDFIQGRLDESASQTERAIVAVAESSGRSLTELREALVQASESSSTSFAELTSILANRYVDVDTFNNRLNNYITDSGLQNELDNYVTKDVYNQDLQQFVTNETLNTEYMTLQEIESRERSIVQQITDKEVTLNENFNQRVQSLISQDRFPQVLAQHIPNFQSLVRTDRMDAVNELLRTDITSLKNRMNAAQADRQQMRNLVEILNENFENYRQQIAGDIGGVLENNNVGTEIFRKTINELVQTLQSRATDLESFEEEVKPLLGLDEENPDSRMFAKVSELNDAQDKIGTLQTARTNLDTRITNLINNRISPLETEQTERGNLIDNELVNRNNPSDIQAIADKVEANVSGYSQDQMQTILDNFVVNNRLLLQQYAPFVRRLLAYRVSVSENSIGNLEVGLSKIDDLVKNEYDDDDTTTSGKLQIADVFPNADTNKGEAYNVSINDMLTKINDNVTDVDAYRVLLNKKDVYLIHPLSTTVGQQEGADETVSFGSLRPKVTIEDDTFKNDANSAYDKADPVVLRAQTLQEYDGTNQRVDRISAVRPWASSTSAKRPSKFAFKLYIDIAMNSFGFDYANA